MNIRLLKLRLFFTQYSYQIILIALSATGFLLGIILSAHKAHQTPEIDLLALCVAPTYFSLWAVNVIPVLIIVFLLFFSLTRLCYPFVLLRYVCRGFLGMFFYVVFGSGAWLIRIFLCFSGYVTTILIWWLLFRNFHQQRTNLRKDTCLSLLIISMITAIDFQIVVPFFSNIFV